MEIVSNTSGPELAKNRARALLRGPVRRLVANLLRVLRGAGSPEELPSQLNALTEAYIEFEAAFRHSPSGYELQRALEIEEKPVRSDLDLAKEDLVRAALRLVAGKLVHQNIQIRGGENDLTAAALRYAEAWEASMRKLRGDSRKRSRPSRRD
jgi:hypothetical protein